MNNDCGNKPCNKNIARHVVNKLSIDESKSCIDQIKSGGLP